jgi:F1F0 ATPase subunit 2
MTASICAVVGIALGAAYVATLARSVALFVAGRTGAAVALQAARLAVVALVMVLMARRGAMPLVAGSCGFVAARTWRLRRPR